MGKKILFNENWEFKKQQQEENITLLTSNYGWNKVDLPHDWMIYDTSYFYESTCGWYRKNYHIQKKEKIRYSLRFEGVYMDTTIYVNEKVIYEWKYGYSTFEVDITDSIIDGCNHIAVKVNVQMPNSRWYSGAGIYRNVWLYERSETHFETDGIYIASKEEGDTFEVSVQSEILSEGHYVEELREGQVITYSIIDREKHIVSEISTKEKNTTWTLHDIKVWDIERPYLYTIIAKLWENDVVIDEQKISYGFRTIEFDREKGFFLNHKHVKLKGTCEHHDLGALGAAVNKTAIRKRLQILKDMGVNSIRTSHNMCAVELLELADEMGILINAESFDMWKRSKTTYDYARFFHEWVEKDVASWIRRDRNHPSIIMWCIGNEIYDTHVDEGGQDTTRYLVDLVRKYDRNGHAPITIGSNYMPWENARKCADIVKLAGYNYAEKYYETHHKEQPDWCIYGSETGSIVQSRGIYHFPYETGILCDDDEQCSSLGNSTTSWGARSIEKCITDDRDASFSAGMYIWSGFDYIGEPTPYHTKNSYFGQIDTAGLKKDSYYIYQSAWTSYKDSPMIHIFPYWDFNEGQIIDVRVCSNAPKIELFYNEISQGIVRIDHKKGKDIVPTFKIEYKPGTLTAIAYDENNNIIAVDIKESYTDATQIVLTPDKVLLQAGSDDLIYVEISMKDLEGREVCNASNRVMVKVEGAGRLIGLDNGDSTDYESYKGTSRRLFSGKLVAIIAARTIAGPIYMEVSSVGLDTASMELTAIEGEMVKGRSYREENKNLTYNSEIPVRKIQINSLKGNKLSNKLREIEINAVLYPDNTTYKDIIWAATNHAGVESNIVSIEPKEKSLKITALGDGDFYIRAMTKNGGDKIRIISTMNFNISGMGTAYYNPYEFVSGSLYSKSYGEIGNGNERGAATSRDGESILIYDKLEFGPIGSSKITLPIFELGSKPTRIQIYEGDPRMEEHILIGDVVYHKTSIWNTYQEATYELTRKLKGITSIAFVLNDKIHLKGFYFEKAKKAYERLLGVESDNLYGDSYELLFDRIASIGNNVTVVYEDMDFGECGCNRIRITGKSHYDKNTIRLIYSSKDVEIVENIEFPFHEEMKEIEFAIPLLHGEGTIEFVFLPGSNFDLEAVQFIES